MEGKPISACEKMRLEEARQENLMGSMKFIFKELSPKNKFRLLNDLLRDEAISEQKYLRLCFENVIEPCPICGSHDLYFKVRQEYKDMVRKIWNPKFNIFEIDYYKMPIKATGTFMCGTCKTKVRTSAAVVPELYKRWNEYAIEHRRW